MLTTCRKESVAPAFGLLNLPYRLLHGRADMVRYKDNLQAAIETAKPLADEAMQSYGVNGPPWPYCFPLNHSTVARQALKTSATVQACAMHPRGVKGASPS